MNEAVPFDEALRRAIERSGLGLARIKDKTALRGVDISTATLSNWQNGKSRPEGQRSLAAVAALEQVLRLEPGDLRTLLPPTRPRGRGASTRPEPTSRMSGIVPHWDRVRALIAQLEEDERFELRPVTHHETMRLGPGGTVVHHRVRSTLRAAVDDARRVMAFSCDEVAATDLPRVDAVVGCRVRASALDPDLGIVVAVLELPAPGSAGSRHLMEFDIVHSAQFRPGSLEVHMPHSLRECALVVSIDPDAEPLEFLAVASTDGEEWEAPVVPTNGSVTFVRSDVKSGLTALRWRPRDGSFVDGRPRG